MGEGRRCPRFGPAALTALRATFSRESGEWNFCGGLQRACASAPCRDRRGARPSAPRRGAPRGKAPTMRPRSITSVRSHRPGDLLDVRRQHQQREPVRRRAGATAHRGRGGRRHRRRASAPRGSAALTDAVSQRATQTFCWLPPESVRDRLLGPARADAERADPPRAPRSRSAARETNRPLTYRACERRDEILAQTSVRR